MLCPTLALPAPFGKYIPRPATAAEAGAAILPVYETRLHYAGNIWLAINNHGGFGTFGGWVHVKDREPLRLKYSPSCEFPPGTRNEYIALGGLWVGGVIGPDTLVSTNIYNSEFTSFDTVSESSSSRESLYYDRLARAEQQYYAHYTDTIIPLYLADELEGRLHKPLHIAVSQTSYAWSDRYSRQFVIIECWITNIGKRQIDKLALGIFCDADIRNMAGRASGINDDIAGFLGLSSSEFVPGSPFPLNVGWMADNDGDPLGGQFTRTSPDGAVGLRILRAPPYKRLSFNWWAGFGNDDNFGPIRLGTRAPGAGYTTGQPLGDRNRYYVMTNGEIDYDQMLTGLDNTGRGWAPRPRTGACDFADGRDTGFLLSVGPACEPLMPGDSVPFVYAICAGEEVHTDPLLAFSCVDPDEYMSSLDGSALALAATWAGWVYDTPGTDTDDDGYAGEYYLLDCDSTGESSCDTLYYTGDLGMPPRIDQNCEYAGRTGGPDYAGPETPPCPQAGQSLTIETHPYEIIARWSGRHTETSRDALSRTIDFEGYRLYVSRSGAADRYSIIASWDIEDYQRYLYDPRRGGRWKQVGDPMTIPELQEYFDDPDLDPAQYRIPSLQTCYKESVIVNGFPSAQRWYFAPQEANHDNDYEENGRIQRNIIQRLADSTIVDELGDTLTYGTYEAHITGLNPAYGLYVTLTAFDYGNPRLGLDPLESNPGRCFKYAIPIASADVVEDSGLGVSVYPNPYKSYWEGSDGRMTSYFALQLEAPEKEGRTWEFEEYDRRIWFINLPREARIRIYSLDGDLIRDLHHPDPNLSPYSSCIGWDLISRNTQAVVSGIYIYRVDSNLGSQTGKIVIIK